MNKKSLNLDPFLLFFSEIISTLSLLNFLVELFNNNGYEQIHNKERSEENVQNEKDRYPLTITFNRNMIQLETIDSVIHHIWPHF